MKNSHAGAVSVPPLQVSVPSSKFKSGTTFLQALGPSQIMLAASKSESWHTAGAGVSDPPLQVMVPFSWLMNTKTVLHAPGPSQVMPWSPVSAVSNRTWRPSQVFVTAVDPKHKEPVPFTPVIDAPASVAKSHSLDVSQVKVSSALQAVSGTSSSQLMAPWTPGKESWIAGSVSTIIIVVKIDERWRSMFVALVSFMVIFGKLFRWALLLLLYWNTMLYSLCLKRFRD